MLISCFTVCAVSLVHGLLECAIVLTLLHDKTDQAFSLNSLRILSLAFVMCGLLLILITEGQVTFQRTFARLILWGVAMGCSIGLVTGRCLLEFAILTENNGMLFTQNFFTNTRVYGFCMLTVPALLCGKAIWCAFIHFSDRGRKTENDNSGSRPQLLEEKR